MDRLKSQIAVILCCGRMQSVQIEAQEEQIELLTNPVKIDQQTWDQRERSAAIVLDRGCSGFVRGENRDLGLSPSSLSVITKSFFGEERSSG